MKNKANCLRNPEAFFAVSRQSVTLALSDELLLSCNTSDRRGTLSDELSSTYPEQKTSCILQTKRDIQ